MWIKGLYGTCLLDADRVTIDVGTHPCQVVAHRGSTYMVVFEGTVKECQAELDKLYARATAHERKAAEDVTWAPATISCDPEYLKSLMRLEPEESDKPHDIQPEYLP